MVGNYPGGLQQAAHSCRTSRGKLLFEKQAEQKNVAKKKRSSGVCVLSVKEMWCVCKMWYVYKTSTVCTVWSILNQLQDVCKCLCYVCKTSVLCV